MEGDIELPVIEVCDECGERTGTCNCCDWDSEKIKKKCSACEYEFIWNDCVVIVDDKLYHKDCVTLLPIGYIAMLDDEPLGETENDDGQMAFEIIDNLLDDEED
jgi:hypothetical protein